MKFIKNLVIGGESIDWQNRALESAKIAKSLLPFVEHLTGCDAIASPHRDAEHSQCTCGLSAAVAKANEIINQVEKLKL